MCIGTTVCDTQWKLIRRVHGVYKTPIFCIRQQSSETTNKNRFNGSCLTHCQHKLPCCHRSPGKGMKLMKLIFCRLFSTSFDVCVVRWPDDGLEKILKEAVVTYSRSGPSIFLEELRKTSKNLSQDSRCPDQDTNRAPTEYKSRALPLGKCIRWNWHQF
jgi:hypothetical protein